MRTVAGTPATVRTSLFSIPANAAHRLELGGASTASDPAIGSLGYGLALSTAGWAAEFTISHLPLIFWSWWVTATYDTT